MPACKSLAASDTLPGLGVPFGVHVRTVEVLVGSAEAPIPAGLQGRPSTKDTTTRCHATHARCPPAFGCKGSTVRRAFAVSTVLHQKEKLYYRENNKNSFGIGKKSSLAKGAETQSDNIKLGYVVSNYSTTNFLDNRHRNGAAYAKMVKKEGLLI